MTRLLLLVALLGAFATQIQAQPDSFVSAPLRPLTPSKRGAVFPAKRARDFNKQCSRASPSGYWTSVSPSQNEIQRLEAALPRFIASQKARFARQNPLVVEQMRRAGLNEAQAQQVARSKTAWAGRFNDYFYQYSALARDKKRFIYVNAVPARSEEFLEPKFRNAWRRVPEIVCDGGPDFWGVEFDVQSGRFCNPAFNGAV